MKPWLKGWVLVRVMVRGLAVGLGLGSGAGQYIRPVNVLTKPEEQGVCVCVLRQAVTDAALFTLQVGAEGSHLTQSSSLRFQGFTSFHAG